MRSVNRRDSPVHTQGIGAMFTGTVLMDVPCTNMGLDRRMKVTVGVWAGLLGWQAEWSLPTS